MVVIQSLCVCYYLVSLTDGQNKCTYFMIFVEAILKILKTYLLLCFECCSFTKCLLNSINLGVDAFFSPPTPWSKYILPVAILFTAKKGISKRVIKTWVQNHDLSGFRTRFVVLFCIFKVFIVQVAKFVLCIWPILEPGSTQWSFSPIVHVLGWRRYLEHPEETHVETGKTCKLHNSRIQYLAVRSPCF